MSKSTAKPRLKFKKVLLRLGILFVVLALLGTLLFLAAAGLSAHFVSYLQVPLAGVTPSQMSCAVTTFSTSVV